MDSLDSEESLTKLVKPKDLEIYKNLDLKNGLRTKEVRCLKCPQSSKCSVILPNKYPCKRCEENNLICALPESILNGSHSLKFSDYIWMKIAELSKIQVKDDIVCFNDQEYISYAKFDCKTNNKKEFYSAFIASLELDNLSVSRMVTLSEISTKEAKLTNTLLKQLQRKRLSTSNLETNVPNIGIQENIESTHFSAGFRSFDRVIKEFENRGGYTRGSALPGSYEWIIDRLRYNKFLNDANSDNLYFGFKDYTIKHSKTMYKNMLLLVDEKNNSGSPDGIQINEFKAYINILKLSRISLPCTDLLDSIHLIASKMGDEFCPQYLKTILFNKDLESCTKCETIQFRLNNHYDNIDKKCLSGSKIAYGVGKALVESENASLSFTDVDSIDVGSNDNAESFAGINEITSNIESAIDSATDDTLDVSASEWVGINVRKKRKRSSGMSGWSQRKLNDHIHSNTCAFTGDSMLFLGLITQEMVYYENEIANSMEGFSQMIDGTGEDILLSDLHPTFPELTGYPNAYTKYIPVEEEKIMSQNYFKRRKKDVNTESSTSNDFNLIYSISPQTMENLTPTDKRLLSYRKYKRPNT